MLNFSYFLTQHQGIMCFSSFPFSSLTFCFRKWQDIDRVNVDYSSGKCESLGKAKCKFADEKSPKVKLTCFWKMMIKNNFPFHIFQIFLYQFLDVFWMQTFWCWKVLSSHSISFADPPLFRSEHKKAYQTQKRREEKLVFMGKGFVFRLLPPSSQFSLDGREKNFGPGSFFFGEENLWKTFFIFWQEGESG